MGDIGVDRWTWKMNEHKRRGHHFVKYNEISYGRNEDESEQKYLTVEQDLNAETGAADFMSKEIKNKKKMAEV